MKETTELSLYLIRHGQSFANLRPEIIGGQSPQALLTPEGEIQARRLGVYLDHIGIHFTKVVSSPFPRARKTCALVLEEMGLLNLPVEEVPELVEVSQGDWEGCPRSERYTPAVLEEMNKLGYLFRPPNGESQLDVQKRALGWIKQNILHNHLYFEKSESFGIFGHGHTMKMILQGIMGFSEPRAHRIEIQNTTVIPLKYSKKSGWELKNFGNTTHLVDISLLEKFKARSLF